MKEVFDSWVKGDRWEDKWYGRDADYPAEADSLGLWLARNAAAGRTPSTWDQLRRLAPAAGWSSPGNKCGYAFWYYSAGANSIVQPTNTNYVSFYYSPYPVPEYDVAFRVYSTDSDDDAIGFVAAYTPSRPSDGKPQVACFVRSPNSSNWDCTLPYYHWCLDSDCTAFPAPGAGGRIAAHSPALSTQVFDGGRTQLSCRCRNDAIAAFWRTRRMPWEDNPDLVPAAAGLTEAEKSLLRTGGLGWTHGANAAAGAEIVRKVTGYATGVGGWKGYGAQNYAYIRVRREGDRLSAWTTRFTRAAKAVERGAGDFGGPASPPSDWNAACMGDAPQAYCLTVDMAAEPSLSAFAGAQREKCRAGFMTYSQPFATYEVISAALPRVYVKAWTNEVWRETLAGGLEKVSGVTGTQYVGAGRLCVNPATGKAFYDAGQAFVKVTPSAVKANPPGTPSARLETVEIDRALYQVGYTAKTLMLSAGSAVSVYDEMADIKSRLDAELGELNRIV